MSYRRNPERLRRKKTRKRKSVIKREKSTENRFLEIGIQDTFLYNAFSTAELDREAGRTPEEILVSLRNYRTSYEHEIPDEKWNGLIRVLGLTHLDSQTESLTE